MDQNSETLGSELTATPPETWRAGDAETAGHEPHEQNREGAEEKAR